MQPNSSSPVHARSLRRRPAAFGILAFAVVLVPLLGHPAAAQQRDRSSVMSFRTDVAESRSELPYTPEEVWNALSLVYAEFGFPMDGTSNPRTHEYRTVFMDVRSQLFGKPNPEFFACQQTDMLADLTNTGQITFALRSIVLPAAGGGSVLSTQVDARARRRATNSSAVECASTGNLEKGLAQAVLQKVGQTTGR